MNSPRNILLIALLFISYLLWMQWQEDYNRAPTAVATSTAPAATGATRPTPATGASNPEVPTPSATTTTTAEVPAAPLQASPSTQTKVPHVVVTTDVLRVEIDPRGGSVVVADLLKYPQSEKPGAPPVRLLDDQDPTFFEAQTGLVSGTGAAPAHDAVFTAAQNNYAMADGATTLEVPLTWTDPSGVVVRKVFVFHRDSYVIEQRQEVDNKSATAWTGNAYRQLQRVPPIIDTHGIKGYSNTARYSFVGAAWYSPTD